MARRKVQSSPILGAVRAMINEASETLVTRESRFLHTFEVSVDRVRPDLDQPRKRFDEANIRALATTMAEQGQLQPILVRQDHDARNGWILVAGERRWRAAKLNGWETMLAIDYPDDPEVAMLIENLQRVDLSPIEEARGLQRLIEGKGWAQNDAAKALGKTKGEVSATLRILTLPEDVLTSELDIPRNVLVELARIEAAEPREHLIRLARDGLLTVRAVRAARDTKQPAGIAPRPSVSKSATARLTLRSLEKVTAALRAARTSGRSLAAPERRRLEELRMELDAILNHS